MSAPYSDDLRKKVMVALDRGEKKSHVSWMFNISRNTIDLWVKRRQATATVHAPKVYQKGHGHQTPDFETFRQFAKANGDKTQTEMAEAWEGTISGRTISPGLHNIGYTQKKDLWIARTGRTAMNRKNLKSSMVS